MIAALVSSASLVSTGSAGREISIPAYSPSCALLNCSGSGFDASGCSSGVSVKILALP